MPLSQAMQRDSVFVFPKEGTYLHEVQNGQRTTLLNEDEIEAGPDELIRPLRKLDNFFIFDPSTKTCVPPSAVWESDGPYEAFGWVVPQLVDDKEDHLESESDDLEGINIRTSTVWRFIPDIDNDNIYIETQYAFYMLKIPHPSYYDLFLPFYTKEMLLRLVLRAIRDDPNLTKDRLLLKLSMTEDAFLGRCWTETDFTDKNQYGSIDELTRVIQSYGGIDHDKICEAPILKLLLRSQINRSKHTPARKRTLDQTSHPHSRSTGSNATKPRASRKREEDTPSLTTVTPLVNSLVEGYTEKKLIVVGKRPLFLNVDMFDRGRPRTPVSDDQTEYKKGDFILLNEEDEEDEEKQRFAQILYISDHRKRNRTYHVRWFVHGSQTLLEEVAFGQELFLSIADGCGDVSEDCIICKCKAVRLTLKEYARQKWPPRNTFFYVSSWDRMNPVDFHELTDYQVQSARQGVCIDCTRRDKRISSTIGSYPDAIAVIESIRYHTNDFIRYEADKPDKPDQLVCSIGQITKIFPSKDSEVSFEVRKLGRERYRKGCRDQFKELALFMTSSTDIVLAHAVIGKVQVIHIDEYRMESRTWMDNHPDCFYVASKADSLTAPLQPFPSASLKQCNVCSEKLMKEEEAYTNCRNQNVLKAFDPYIGAGGFGQGLAQGCSMSTVVGIEVNPDAALTAKKNFPASTKIINDDACKIFKDLVTGTQRRVIFEGVNFIYSGPPCQNDSGLNQHKSDPRCPPFTLLSFTEVIRPSFFIMEAVTGFLQCRIFKDTPKEIKTANLKLIIRILRFLGYNVGGRLMDARSYGVPQTRDRFFIMATLPEYGPPKFPDPTHAFNHRTQVKGMSHTVGNDLTLRIATAPGRALHETVTVDEALYDLPPFDWESPRSPTPQEVAKAKERAKVVPTIPTSDKNSLWGIEDCDFQYRTPSTNYFQHLARRNMTFCSEKRYQHMTAHFPSYQIENIIDIPFYKGADYRYLRAEKREWSLRDPASAKASLGFGSGGYSRLNPEGYFQTITTQVGPNAKQSMILHPFCKRIVTVRELARAQGFPDDFSFYAEDGNIKAYHKQIANSVPFGVSAALGSAIQDMVFKRWEQESEQV